VIGKTISQYRVVEKLGDGGMGIVYRAEDSNLHRSVAVKFLSRERMGSEEARQRFIREARAAAALDHPHICTIHEVGATEQGDLYIVMACYDGGSLRGRLRRGRLSVDEALDLAAQATGGLTHAHAAGVIHRDIKPENLLFDREGRLKIVDFGLAKVEREGSLTRTGVIQGTYAYMSPEQALGERVDLRTDVWSLGTVLYEMVTGRPPFRAGGGSTVVHAVLHKHPDPLSSHLAHPPAGLQELLDRALAKEAQDRFSDARELGEALRALRGGRAPAAEAPTVELRPEPGAVVSSASRRVPSQSGSVAGSATLRCAGCGLPASRGQRFCGGCGAELARRCEHCGELNRPGSRYCGACGRLVEATLTSTPRATAERRQLTVLFCELSGGTALAERLDPEELRELMLDYHSVCEQVMRRHDGHVAQYQGDGIFCYFGYPRAHEDDPARAVAAGLELTRAVAELGRSVATLEGVELAARVGLHTGVVVTGDSGGEGLKEDLALGSTPKVAARLQDMGEPGWVVLSASTRRLVRGFFELEDLGERTLRGVSDPLRLYRAMGPRSVRSRFEATAALGLTPAVGRREEVERLTALGRRAVEGRGRAIVLAGEAGIGKSRLLHLARTALAGSIDRWWVCAGADAYRHSALHVAREALRDILGVGPDSGAEAVRAALLAAVEAAALQRRDLLPFLAALLDLPPDPAQPLPPLSPMRIKQKTLEALVELPLALTRERPAALVVEDLHWIDFSTREWLHALLERVASAGLLVVMTTRPEGLEGWDGTGASEVLSLDRLGREDVEGMILSLAGGKPLPSELVERIVAKTDGVPLFVEELTKTILESGVVTEREREWSWTAGRTRGRLAIPDTLKDSLTARLDRLEEAKGIAQLGSVLGRRFTFDRLAAVSGLEPAPLAARLGELETAGLVWQTGTPPESEYLFKHALVRDAAYQSLLRSERRQLHEHVARILEDRFPEVERGEPEVLAGHYEHAQRPVQAVGYLQRAGERALASWAFVEALGHLDHGLELLEGIEASPQRDELELGLQLARGLPLVATTGYTSEPVEGNYQRASDLATTLGRDDVGFGIRYRTWGMHLLRGSVLEANRRVQELAELAGRTGRGSDALAAASAGGITRYYSGAHADAMESLKRAADGFEPSRHYDRVARFADDPCFGALVTWGWALALAGLGEEGLAAVRGAVEAAEALANPVELARGLAHLNVALFSAGRADDEFAATVGRCLEVSTAEGFPVWIGYGRLWNGWLETREGNGAGIAEMQAGMDLLRQLGLGSGRALSFGVLADGHLHLGEAAAGLKAVEEGLQVVESTGERLWEPELLHLRAELRRLDEPGSEEARMLLGRARELARARGSRQFELRAAVSLARASAGTDGAAVAAGALRESLDDLDETATPLVADARSLLDELG